MTDYHRFAIYFAPPSGSALARFGASWLGWDAETGGESAHPVETCAGLPVAEITQTPRKYGFHGTLKPPFRLAGGTDRAGLSAAVAKLAADHRAFQTAPLTCARLGRFCALVPSARSVPLAALATDCVQSLDRFRAPPTQAELQKRRAHPLTPSQEENLARWGYPYVLDEFRFHLTLTGPFDDDRIVRITDALTVLTAPHCANPMPVREICLFGEAADGRFRILERHPLTA